MTATSATIPRSRLDRFIGRRCLGYEFPLPNGRETSLEKLDEGWGAVEGVEGFGFCARGHG